MDLGNPTSYLVLGDGTPVLTSDGQEVGKVEHVLADADSDVFDGVIVDMPGGHRFADAPLVEAIYERGVVLAMTAGDAEHLPEPTDNPATLEASPDDTAPDELTDKLKRAWDYLSGNY
jgi:PRC-barrel domain